MSALLRAFREGSGSAAAGGTERDAVVLGPLLAALYARGRKVYPRLVVPEPAFGRYLARCATAGGARSLADVAVEDVYLACACAERVRGGEGAFERRFGRVIRRAVSRVLALPDDRQEAEQRAWQHLLVRNPEGPPRIAQYLGQGSLEKWVAVASMRVAISFGRRESAEKRLRDKAIVETSGIDPENMFMKGELRDAFEAAVSQALDRLKPRERLVLKLYLVSGMSLGAIGKSLGVTRQAVSKTIAQARERMVGEIDAAVRHRLKMSPDELTSMLRFVASQLDVSISRVLGSG